MALQTGAFALEQDVPAKIIFSDSNYTSTSDASLNRRHTKFPPKNDTTFQPRGTREIEFQISSQTSFIDFANMYITGKFLNRTTYSGGTTDSTTAEAQLLAMIEKGGIDSLFETVILENASTGATIDKIENYNTWVSLFNEVFKSPEEATEIYSDQFDWSSHSLLKDNNYVGKAGAEEYFLNGSSDAYETKEDLETSFVTVTDDKLLDLNITNIRANAATITSTDQASEILKLLVSLQPGDQFRIRTPTDPAVNKQFRVLHVRNLTGDSSNVWRRIIVQGLAAGLNSTPTLDTGDFDGSSDGPLYFQISNRGEGQNWRAYVGSSMAPDGNGDSTSSATKETRGEILQFVWKPKLQFLKMKKYYPLFLHSSGLRLRCILDPNVYHSFYSVSSPSKDLGLSSLDFDYQLSDVRMAVVVYDFHSSINKEYLDSYKSSKGLLFPFRGIHYSGNQLVTSVGSTSISITPGVRSARSVITRLTTDTVFSSKTPASLHTPSLSFHPGLFLSEYQYTSGSLVFPQRPIQFIDAFGMENRKHAMIMTKKTCYRHEVNYEGAEPHNMPATHNLNPFNMDTNGGTIYGVYNSSADTIGVHVDGKNAGLMFAVLSREMDGRFSGLDLSIQPLKLDMTFSKALPSTIASNRIAHTFITYDSYLHLGESTGVTILN